MPFMNGIEFNKESKGGGCDLIILFLPDKNDFEYAPSVCALAGGIVYA
jgi:hypothetical protein